MDELLEAAATIRNALGARDWKHWATALAARTDVDGLQEQVEHTGLVLDALRSFGPGSLGPEAPPERDRLDDPSTFSDRDLTVLVATSAVFWPARSEPWS